MTTSDSSPSETGKLNKATDAFHAHLDVCHQCRNHPFDLCPMGTVLANQAFAELTSTMEKQFGFSRIPPEEQQ